MMILLRDEDSISIQFIDHLYSAHNLRPVRPQKIFNLDVLEGLTDPKKIKHNCISRNKSFQGLIYSKVHIL